MRTLALCLALLLSTYAGARVHRGRPHEAKIFAAHHDSVKLENEAADAMGTFKFYTQAELDEAVYSGKLAAIYNHTSYVVAPKLPINRRYALPATVRFLDRLSIEYFRATRHPLMVDSAVRPATVQRSLMHWNRSAAPAYGVYPSSHERGTTFDLSLKMAFEQRRWLLVRLLYYRALGRVLVIQERSCLHIFVIGESNEPAR